MIHTRNSNVIRKLRHGERCWLAEVVLRAAGLGLLLTCALLARGVVHEVHRTVVETPAEFALAMLGFFCLTGGFALLLFGPHLFKLMPTPPRALF